MSQNTEPFDYDETEVVKFIKNALPQELKDKFTDDEITYVLDILYDFYEEKGFLDDEQSDENDVVDLDEDEIIKYVLKCTRKDKIKEFTEEEITFIIQGEILYCESLGMFD